MPIILTCNAGSSNTKLAEFDSATLKRSAGSVAYSEAEIIAWFSGYRLAEVVAIGHRVVHGGRDFTSPALINSDVIDKIKSYIPLAPLHQPAALALIEQAMRFFPTIAHIACFDTAFHNTVPDIERRLPLPSHYHESGVMRYGFHGLSYEYIASRLPEYAGEKAHGRVIAAHLGGGSSACAMNKLKSVATTMGFSTLDGMMMGTRCGALDPGAILHLLQQDKMPPEQVERLLYKESGLLGVSGISADMRELAASDSPKARIAIDLYCYQAAKQISGLLPALGGIDVLVFTGGIGENSEAVREKITSYLRWAGDFAVYAIPTDEEYVIASSAKKIIKV